MQTSKVIPEIIYYDFGEVKDISFYINGLLSNQKQYNYKFRIKREKPYFLKQSSVSEDWYKYVFRLGIFEFKNGENTFFFCVDWCDHSSNYMNEGYLIPVLEKVRYYFKANYNATAIDDDPELKKFRDTIIPTGPSFPLHIENMIRFMPRVFPGNDTNWTIQECRDRLGLLLKKPGLRYLRHLRKTEPDLSLFFVLTYYQDQKLLNDFRYEVMKAIENIVKPNAIMGFASKAKLPGKYQYFEQPQYEMRNYYRHLARSKVSIYVRGPHDGISSKMGQLLVLGKPIIGQTIHNNKDLYYQCPFFDEQFAYDDPEEIASQLKGLLHDPERAALYSKANANTFDTKFSPEITVSNMIEILFH